MFCCLLGGDACDVLRAPALVGVSSLLTISAGEAGSSEVATTSATQSSLGLAVLPSADRTWFSDCRETAIPMTSNGFSPAAEWLVVRFRTFTYNHHIRACVSFVPLQGTQGTQQYSYTAHPSSNDPFTIVIQEPLCHSTRISVVDTLACTLRISVDFILTGGHPTVLFGLIVLFGLVELAISAWLTARYGKDHGGSDLGVRTRSRYGLRPTSSFGHDRSHLPQVSPICFLLDGALLPHLYGCILGFQNRKYLDQYCKPWHLVRVGRPVFR
jgi:hypothetical protein